MQYLSQIVKANSGHYLNKNVLTKGDSMHNASEFGKDLSLVHEMVITGRKAGATREMYSLFASNQEWFARIAKLGHHLEVIERLQIELKPISVDKAEGLIEWTGTIMGSDCFACGIGFEERLALSRFMSEEQLRKDSEELAGLQDKDDIERKKYFQRDRYHKEFFARLTKEVEKAGLHPAELTAFCVLKLDDRDNHTLTPENANCFNMKDFTRMIHRIVAQRNLLVQIKAEL